MRRSYLLLTVGLACSATFVAQARPGSTGLSVSGANGFIQVTVGEPQAVFQSFAVGRGGTPNTMPSPRTEKGKPFSATATTQTTQILADGTHVNQTATMLEYRDSDGRVRTETSEPARATIVDPVAGVSYTLDPARRTAVKIPQLVMDNSMLAIGGRGGRGGRGSSGGRGGRGGSGGFQAGALGGMTGTLPVVQAQFQPQADRLSVAVNDAQAARNSIVEDLGTMTINGVAARGTRTTTIVPVGAIGNDREFHSISERWFSSDLNLLIKSVNTDPRFGTTTYELMNISRLPPDPSLFQVPADYNVIGR